MSTRSRRRKLDGAGESTASPFATLVVSGDEVNPDTVSQALGLSPSEAFKAGDAYSRGHVRKHGMWALSSQDHVVSEDLEDHVRWLLDRIEPVQAALHDYLRAKDSFGFITCFWPLPHGHGGPEFSPALMRRVGAVDLPLQIDAYLTGPD